MDSRRKQIVYAEGLEAGFNLAKDAIEEFSNGLMTILPPPQLTDWQKRAAKLRYELEDERFDKLEAQNGD